MTIAKKTKTKRKPPETVTIEADLYVAMDRLLDLFRSLFPRSVAPVSVFFTREELARVRELDARYGRALIGRAKRRPRPRT